MRRGCFLLAAALIAFGCAKEEAGTLPSEPQITIWAGFDDGAETRSRLEADESVATVLWTKGDSFRCLYGFNGGSFYYTTFTTQDDGVTQAAFSTTSNSLSGEEFQCFYPVNTKVSNVNGERIFGMNLPVVQQAVAGGIAEGLNRAYAFSTHLTKTLDEPLRFYNIPSLVKFRLDGAVVPRVKEIKLSGPGSLAGDFVIHNVNGVPVEYPGIYFDGDVHSSDVVLQGDFQADTDYYIAIWPCQLSRFQMEFSDGAGRYTLKTSSKKVSFERSRVKDLGTIHLGDDFTSQDAGDYDPILYMSATEGSKPVTIAVIPEGFTAEQMPLFESLAKSGVDALFETEPYKTYRNRFNVYLLRVASRESGASITDGNGNVKTVVSTYFDARWGESSYGDMAANGPRVYEFVGKHCPDILNGTHTIQEVPVLMIINDTRYGGICYSSSSGQGYGMIPYTSGGEGLIWYYPDVTPSTNDPLPTPVTDEILQANYHRTTSEELAAMGQSRGDWRNILVHEFGGHCFGRLGDEYWPDGRLGYVSGAVPNQDWPVPYSLNLASNPASTPWASELLARRDELAAMNPLYGRIGAFQGGGNYLYGRWRSEMTSCMIDNRFYFSAWQRYLIVKRIFTLSGDQAAFSFDAWLAKDVPTDPVRDVAPTGSLGAKEHRSYRVVGQLPPPVLTED